MMAATDEEPTIVPLSGKEWYCVSTLVLQGCHAALISIAERVTTEPKPTLSVIGKSLFSGTDQSDALFFFFYLKYKFQIS